MNLRAMKEEVKLFSTPIAAIVEVAIAPSHSGRVKCMGTYWPARLYHNDCNLTLEPNQKVQVVGIANITLLVVR
ncbi:MAG: NfeD family protein [Oscillatoria sp. PMC 1051.18]|nr:NfeD family protein [Oscillatoria sp. PMC 1050.18]MEC5030998.1 NfeD family protein [Oscillatoria sp. PMC 1051.18]